MKKHSDYKSAVAYNRTMTSFKVSCVGAGGHCPATSLKLGGDGFPDPGPWADQVAANPVPLAYTLMSIDEVLTADRFPSDANIGKRSDTLRLFLALHYCSIAPCAVPSKDGYWVGVAGLGMPQPDGSEQHLPSVGVALAVLNDA
eukprot:4445892-Prymnesium_polylepis.1